MQQCGFVGENQWFCVSKNITIETPAPVICCESAKPAIKATVRKAPPESVSPATSAQLEAAAIVAGAYELSCVGCTFLRDDFRCAIYSSCSGPQKRVKAILNGCKFQKPRMLEPAPRLESAYYDEADLLRYTLLLEKNVPWSDVGAVLGVSRSGVIPASILAARNAKPLFCYNVNTHSIIQVGKGSREIEVRESKFKYLVVDDSVAGGNQLVKITTELSKRVGNKSFLTAAVFANPSAIIKPTFVGAWLPLPHFFSWNLFCSHMTNICVFDIDGVVCEDPPPECWPEGEAYEEWLLKARLLNRVWSRDGCIFVSLRLERFREQTEEWLKKNNIPVKELILWPYERSERWRDNSGARWKATTFQRLKEKYPTIRYFVESDHRIARVIAECWVDCLCVEDRRLYRAVGI